MMSAKHLIQDRTDAIGRRMVVEDTIAQSNLRRSLDPSSDSVRKDRIVVHWIGLRESWMDCRSSHHAIGWSAAERPSVVVWLFVRHYQCYSCSRGIDQGGRENTQLLRNDLHRLRREEHNLGRRSGGHRDVPDRGETVCHND